MKRANIFSLLGVATIMAVGLMVVGCSQKRPTKSVATSGKQVSSLKSVHFDFDRSSIRSDQRSTLDDNVTWLKQNTRTDIRIEGNCDERGSEEYNIALGQRRANSVRNFLVSSGVSASRLKTVSYGEEKPQCRDSNEGCWYKNRRADFTK